MGLWKKFVDSMDLKPDEEEIKEEKVDSNKQGLFEEYSPSNERKKDRKWIKVVFNISTSDKKVFDRHIKIIEEETKWNINEDYGGLKKKGITNFQVGGSFTIKEFLKLKEGILKAREKLSKKNKKPVWYIIQIDETIEGEETETFSNLEESFDITTSLLTPLLNISFFLEKLQDLNKKDKEIIKKMLGDYLEKIELANAPDGFITWER